MGLREEEIKRIAEYSHNWDRIENKTILISGGTGFLGSLFIDVIKYRNNHFNSNIHVISLSRRGGVLDSTVTHLKVDITNTIDITQKVDFILHLASNTHPKQYSEDPVGTITTNVIGCNNLLKLAVEKKCTRFLLASSVEIYGQGDMLPMNESYCGYIDCTDVRSGYNESKRTCESLCQAYMKQYGIDCVVARLARVFGPDKKNDSKAMAQFITQAVNGENIILKSKGNQRFSYCYYADAVNGIFSVLLEGESGNSYNISDDDEEHSLADYAEIIAKKTGTSVVYDIEQVPGASKAINALIVTDKIKKIGWVPLFSVTEGISRTLFEKKNMNY